MNANNDVNMWQSEARWSRHNSTYSDHSEWWSNWNKKIAN